MGSDALDGGTMTLTIGMLLFPNLTQLDLTAPYEVFSRMPDSAVRVIAATRAPVRTEWGLTIVPDATFDDTTDLDILCVPGGWGVNAMMEDAATLAFVRERGARARHVTSVCTGALLLGAAGLLTGYRATTHWMSHELLARFGAIPTQERVVIDRNRITAAGVTAGIDLALTIAAQLFGDAVCQQIQLAIEYDPAPVFTSGSPRTAPSDVTAAVTQRSAHNLAQRTAIVERVARSQTEG
jgi:cyclohexyl-isocyanide hydratase